MSELVIRYLAAAFLCSLSLVVALLATAIARTYRAKAQGEEEIPVLVLCLACDELMEHRENAWFCGDCWSELPRGLQAQLIWAWADDRTDGRSRRVGEHGFYLDSSCEWLRRAREGAVKHA